MLTATVCQKRELFTYQRLKALYDVVYGLVNYNTGTYIATREDVDLLLNR